MLLAFALAAASGAFVPAGTPAGTAQAAVTPSDGRFASVPIITGLSQPMAFAFAPDGRIFIAQKEGAVLIYKNGALLPTPFIQLTVNSYNEHGLVGMALDPNFARNGYVYFYYTYENDPTNPTGSKTGQVIRVTASGDLALPGSTLVLAGSVTGSPAQPSCQDFPAGSDCIPADGYNHVAGGVRFGADGTLFIATGDASTETPLALRAQDLDSLAGKILRINTDGTAPANNPYFNGNPLANRSRVWQYGLRNPFRFGIKPGTDLPFIGDVGVDSWEEIDRGYPGANFGWPCYEGPVQFALFSSTSTCQALYAANISTPPLYAYPHGNSDAAVIGGVFYQGTSYPAEFQGAFFFADHERSTISILKVDANNNLVPGSQDALTGGDGLVDFEIGPDGDVYYASIGTNEIRHLQFVPTAAGACTVIAPKYDIGVSNKAVPTQTGGAAAAGFDGANSITGLAVNYSAVQAPPGGQGESVTWAAFADSVYVAAGGSYYNTFTANLSGGIGIGGSGGFASARLDIVGIVLDGTTSAPVAVASLRSDQVSGSTPQSTGISVTGQQLTMNVSLPHAGMYTWEFFGLSDAAATGGATSTMYALALRRATLTQSSTCPGVAAVLPGTTHATTQQVLAPYSSVPFVLPKRTALKLR